MHVGPDTGAATYRNEIHAPFEGASNPLNNGRERHDVLHSVRH